MADNTPPADDVREALAKRLADEIEYRVRTAVALAKGGHGIAAEVMNGRASVPGILAQFEVRARGPVTDAEVEAASRAYDAVVVPPVISSRIAMRAALEAAREVNNA